MSGAFELVYGNLVFATAADRTAARNALTKYAARQQLAGSDFTLYDVASGKYGAGPSLNATMWFANRADADAAMADARAFQGLLIPRSVIVQSSIDAAGQLTPVDSISVLV